jgi:hypothetical protein
MARRQQQLEQETAADPVSRNGHARPVFAAVNGNGRCDGFEAGAHAIPAAGQHVLPILDRIA